MLDNLYGKTYKVFEEEERSESRDTVIYSSKVGGYLATSKTKRLEMKVVTPDEYYRYLAGERNHIFENYDPAKHDVHCSVGYPDRYIHIGIPMSLTELSTGEQKKEVKLPPGLYQIGETSFGVALFPMEVKTDKYIQLRKGISSKIYEDLKRFRKNRKLYEDEGVRHKQGVILYGPPGNGKTREIGRILESAKEDNLVAIFVPSSLSRLSSLDVFRKPLEGKDVVFVIEELTERASRAHKIEELLTFLDGEMSWNNVYVIATTNYPQEVPYNVIDRPGRFDLLIDFGNPDSEERKAYLLGRNVPEGEAMNAVELSNGLSVDYLAQAVTQSRARGVDLCGYLKLIKKNREKVCNSFKKAVGFSSDSTSEEEVDAYEETPVYEKPVKSRKVGF